MLRLIICPFNLGKIYTSQYQILTVPGTFPYSKFKNAPEGSLMNKIYNEKVKTAPSHKQLGAITFEESVSVLLNEKYVAYYEMDSFTSCEEYPCQIVDLKYLSRVQVCEATYHKK